MSLDKGPKAPNTAQLQNEIKHITFQQIQRMLSDMGPTPQGGFGVSRISMSSVRSVTASPDLVDPSDFQLNVNAGAATENLPAATDGGRMLFIQNLGTSVAITPNGSDTVNGLASFVLTTPNEYTLIVSDGVSNWSVFSHGVGTTTGNLSFRKMNTTGNILTTDMFLQLDATGGMFTATLPLAATAGKMFLYLTAEPATTNAIDIVASGGDTFYGSSAIGPPQGMILFSDGVSNWFSLNVPFSSGINGTPFAITSSAAGVILAGQGTYFQTVPMQNDATIDTSGDVTVNGASGQFSVKTVGKGLSVKEGSNAKQGTATLVLGTVVVANTSVTANSRIFICGGALNSSTAIGDLTVVSQTATTGFTITSFIPGGVLTQVGDLRTVNYEIFEPA